MSKTILRAVAVLAVAMLSVAVIGCAADQPTTPATTVPQGTIDAAQDAAGTASGEALVQSKCSMCHTLDRVNSVSYDAAKWQATIDRMVKNGAVITAEERQAIVDYLSQRDAQ